MTYRTFFTLIILIIFLNSCVRKSNEKGSEFSSNSIQCKIKSDIYSDSKLYKLEFQNSKVKIAEGLFTIKLVRDKFSKDSIPYTFNTENWWENESPSTMLIYDNSTCELIFSKKFDGVKLTFSKLNGKLNEKGNLYLSLVSSGGGSGYISWLNKIEIINNRIQIQPIFDSNEMSVILFDKKNNNILLMNSIWDMSGWSEEEEGEAHFSPHRISVLKFNINKKSVKKEEIGTTIYKYSLDSKSELSFFDEIRQNEAKLKIKENYYDLIGFNNWTGKFNKVKTLQ